MTVTKKSVASPSTKKSTVKKVTAKKVEAKKPATKRTTSKKAKPSLEALYKMTEVAAYYIALNDGFKGNPTDYWIQAELQIKSLY